MEMPPLAALVRSASDEWDPAVERTILGTGDVREIAALIEGFVGPRCGPVSGGVFYRSELASSPVCV
jgi:hypothetical protein